MLAMVYFWLYSCTVQTRQRGGWRQLVLATSPWAMDDSLTLGQHLSAPRRRLPWPTCDLQTVPNGPCQNDRLPRCSQMWWTIWQWQMPAPEVSWRHLAPLRMGQTWGGQPELRRPTWADVPTASCHARRFRVWRGDWFRAVSKSPQISGWQPSGVQYLYVSLNIPCFDTTPCRALGNGMGMGWANGSDWCIPEHCGAFCSEAKCCQPCCGDGKAACCEMRVVVTLPILGVLENHLSEWHDNFEIGLLLLWLTIWLVAAGFLERHWRWRATQWHCVSCQNGRAGWFKTHKTLGWIWL